MIYGLIKNLNGMQIEEEHNFTIKLGESIFNIFKYCDDEIKAQYSKLVYQKVKNFITKN